MSAIDTFKEKPIYDFFKRLFDILLSALGILLLSPLLLVLWIAVRSDGGPAIYTQTRVGKDGKLFRIYKFRSMVAGADDPAMLAELQKLNEMDGPAFKIKADPRITTVGRFLRRTSMDELPQLFNILKGDMSIVGPRPPLVSEVEAYEEHHKIRLRVKQGLTCYWQCSGRNNIGFEDWMALDAKYVQERSLWTDFVIILKTVPAVLTGTGAV